MNEVDANQQHEAYHLWRFNHYAYRKHDERIVPFLSEQMHETQSGQIIWQKILPEAKVHIFVKSRQPIFKGRALAYIASVLMRKPTFRRRQRWTER